MDTIAIVVIVASMIVPFTGAFMYHVNHTK